MTHQFEESFRSAYARIARDGVRVVKYGAPQWLTVGGAKALVDVESGSILAGCPGLEDEDLDEITNESDTSRNRREAKQEAAESAGWEGEEQSDAREAWNEARESAPEDSIVLLQVGDTYYAFEDSAEVLQAVCDVGDGDSADIKEGGIERYISALVDAGHRVAIAERQEDGDARHRRIEEPEEGLEGFPWESDDDEEPDSSDDREMGQDEADPGDKQLSEVPRQDFTITSPGQVEIDGHDFDVYRHRGGSWFYRKAGRADLGWTFAKEKTAAWIQEQLGLAKSQESPEQTAPPRARSKSEDRFTRTVREAIGDEPIDVDGFKDLALDIWERKRQEASERNHSLRQLLGQFGIDGHRQGAFIRQVQRMEDPSRIRRFDQMVEMARENHPDLLDWDRGSSDGYDDAENALFRRLKTGLVETPAKWSDEVIDEAMEYVAQAEKAYASFQGDSKWDSVPFSRRSSRWWSVVRYAARSASA